MGLSKKKNKVKVFKKILIKDETTGKLFKLSVEDSILKISELTTIETVVSTHKATNEAVIDSLNQLNNQNQ